MSYQIKVPPEVRKEIKDLPGHVRAQARQLISALGENPRPSRAKELRGKPNIYRIWLAGRWRIAYEIDDEDAPIVRCPGPTPIVTPVYVEREARSADCCRDAAG